MGHSDSRVMAGLIFLGETSIDLLDAVTRTADALTGLGQKIQSLGFLSDQDAGVETGLYRVCLALSENVALPGLEEVADVVLRIDVRHRTASDSDTGPSIEAVLAHVAIDLSDHFRPTHLQWIEADAILSATELAGDAETPAKPASKPKPAAANSLQDYQQMARARAALTGAETLDTDLDTRAKDARQPAKVPVCTQDGVIPESLSDTCSQVPKNAEPTDRLRLSAWLLSIAVACIALPVGLALVIFNLLKGENLRLSGQAAALSGLFVSLQANGATAQAIQVVQTVLP